MEMVNLSLSLLMDKSTIILRQVSFTSHRTKRETASLPPVPPPRPVQAKVGAISVTDLITSENMIRMEPTQHTQHQ